MMDRRSAVIVKALSARDIMTAVNFAACAGVAGLDRGGGHGVAESAVCDGGLMLDLSLMKGRRVYPHSKRGPRAEPGVAWGEFDRDANVWFGHDRGIYPITETQASRSAGELGGFCGKMGIMLDSLMSAAIATPRSSSTSVARGLIRERTRDTSTGPGIVLPLWASTRQEPT